MIKLGLVSHAAAFAGAEKMLYNLAKLCQEANMFEVTMFIPGVDGCESDLKAACDAAQIATVWMGAESGPLLWYLYNQKEPTPEQKAHILQGSRTLMFLLQRYNIDMIVCNTATSLMPVLAATELEIPVVTWIHGILDNVNFSMVYDANQRLLCDRTLMALSSQVIYCSHWTEAFYHPLSLSPDKTVHNWSVQVQNKRKVTHQKNDENALEKTTFVCLSTFEESKGIFVLLRAANHLEKQKVQFNWNIELYGDGDSNIKQKMRDYIAKNKLSKRVLMKERVLDVDSVYQNAFCLLQPSFLDSFGMTIIEAMSHSRPVIATKSGGPAEIILDGKTGYLIERNDAEEMADRMLYLMENPEEAETLGAEGRTRYLSFFSEQSAAHTMLPLLEQTFRRYSGITEAQRLIFDITMHQLKSSATLYSASVPLYGTAPAVPYNPNTLCFSGVLRKNRSYNISGVAGTISGVGLLLANIGGSLEHGKVTLRLYQGGELLTQSTLSGGDLKMDNWSWFGFEPITVAAAPLTVEICPEGLDGLGVFELRERRGFFYKVFNKLGCPLKGLDVLQASLLR